MNNAVLRRNYNASSEHRMAAQNPVWVLLAQLLTPQACAIIYQRFKIDLCPDQNIELLRILAAQAEDGRIKTCGRALR